MQACSPALLVVFVFMFIFVFAFVFVFALVFVFVFVFFCVYICLLCSLSGADGFRQWQGQVVKVRVGTNAS